MVLYEGKVAEMKTGEGKTLVATLPAYLWALEGKGVHMVTVNDYLATRDAAWCPSPLPTHTHITSSPADRQPAACRLPVACARPLLPKASSLSTVSAVTSAG